MVRDIESLIEYLYLKSIHSDLLDSADIIVNPRESDRVLGRVCIINKSYPLPDLRSADLVINRFQEVYRSEFNPYIRGIAIMQDDIFVMPYKGIFYFGFIPDGFIELGNCFDYLQMQINKTSVKQLTSTAFSGV